MGMVAILIMFWLVWFLFYGPSTHFRSFWAWSVTLITFFQAVYQYLVHILSPVTDNCSSWISGRRRMAVEFFSWPSPHERMCRTWGSNSGTLACQTILIIWSKQFEKKSSFPHPKETPHKTWLQLAKWLLRKRSLKYWNWVIWTKVSEWPWPLVLIKLHVLI